MNAQTCLFVILFFFFGGMVYADELKVAATISPLADIAEQITGEKVFTILPSGTNPHAFELTVKAVKQLNDVQAIFIICHVLDDWVSKAV